MTNQIRKPNPEIGGKGPVRQLSIGYFSYSHQSRITNHQRPISFADRPWLF